MMNLKISKASAGLASPSIPLQHFSTELLVGFGRKPQTAMFGSDRIHEARWEICDKKACFCSPGRNLKNRAMECSKISGLFLQVRTRQKVGADHFQTVAAGFITS